MAKKTKLTPKYQLLVNSLLEGKSQMEAAHASGLSYNYVRQLLMDSNDTEPAVAVREALGASLEELRLQSGWTAERLVLAHEELYHALKRQGDYKDARKPLQEIGRLLGFYVAKHEHTGKLTVADIMASVDLEDE